MVLGAGGGREMARDSLTPRPLMGVKGIEGILFPRHGTLYLCWQQARGHAPHLKASCWFSSSGKTQQTDNPVPLRADTWQRPESSRPHAAPLSRHREHKSSGPSDLQRGGFQPYSQLPCQPASHPSVCPSKRTRFPLLSPLPSRPHVGLRLGTDQLLEQTTNRVPATVCVSTKPLYAISGASSQALSLPGAAACPWDVQCGLQ